MTSDVSVYLSSLMSPLCPNRQAPALLHLHAALFPEKCNHCSITELQSLSFHFSKIASTAQQESESPVQRPESGHGAYLLYFPF